MSLLDTIIDIYESLFDLNYSDDINLNSKKIQRTENNSTKLETKKAKKIITIYGMITHLGPSFGYINETLYFSYSSLISKIRPEIEQGLKQYILRSHGALFIKKE